MASAPVEPSTLSPRSRRARRAALDAVAALVAEGGMSAATVDAVRDRSGVSKTTLYKHWPNRLCLIIDAFAEQLELQADPVDSGSLRRDLARQLERVSAFYVSPLGRVYPHLLANSMDDPLVADWLDQRLTSSRRRGLEVLWWRAVERGEVRSDLDADIALDVLFGPVMWRLLGKQRPLTGNAATMMVNALLDGVLAHSQPGTRTTLAP